MSFAALRAAKSKIGLLPSDILVLVMVLRLLKILSTDSLNAFSVASNLANFTSINSGVTAKLINTTISFQAVIDDPTAYGAANATCFDDDGTTCVWWNNYHPALASKSCLHYSLWVRESGSGS